MKKLKEKLLIVMENIAIFIALIFFVAVIDLIGLGGDSDIGLGFIFGFLLFVAVLILNGTGKWDEWKEKLKP